jgi:hypothetical protein
MNNGDSPPESRLPAGDRKDPTIQYRYNKYTHTYELLIEGELELEVSAIVVGAGYMDSEHFQSWVRHEWERHQESKSQSDFG